MASIISAGTTSATALNMSADTTGVLQLASNNGTVALTIGTSQQVSVTPSSAGNNFTYLYSAATSNDTVGFVVGKSLTSGNAVALGWNNGGGTPYALVESFSGGSVLALQLTAGGLGIGKNTVASGYKVDVNGKVKATNIDGPSFMALMTSGQSLPSGASTFIQYSSEQFDSASCYNPTGSTVGGIPAYAFRPTTAGYYFVQATLIVDPFVSGNSEFIIRVFKNGTDFVWSNNNQNNTTHFNSFTHTSVVYLNGSTDYIQMSAYTAEAKAVSVPASSQFSAFLLKAD